MTAISLSLYTSTYVDGDLRVEKAGDKVGILIGQVTDGSGQQHLIMPTESARKLAEAILAAVRVP